MNNPKEQRRNDILRAAAELFAQQGYEKTTVSQIVKKVGVAQGTFYLYFDSKEHVRMGVHEQIINEIIEKSFNIKAMEVDPFKKIELLLLSGVETMKRHQELIRVIQREVSCEAVYDEESREMNRKLVGPVCEILQEGMDSGVFAKADPIITAYLIIAMVERVTCSALLWEEPAALEQVTPVILDFLRGALVAK
ncbi:MAG: TetR/AcrR family transcriptional regulator [Clostridia bacterium]|nr:TetR/AcrR family transcriptional regulator [Clostridia bacterium]